MSDRITYFYRNNKAGYSIAKVMNTLSNEVSKNFEIEEFYVPEYRAGLYHIIRNIIFVYKNRNKTGINHITGDIHYCAIALIGCKSILTVHDLSAFKFTKSPIKRWLLKLLWFDIPLIVSDKVVCISETIKNEIQMLSKRKDICVIYNSLQPEFKPVVKEFNKLKPTVLQVGAAWNKNLLNVIDALKLIDCVLRVIGKPTDDVLRKIEENNVNCEFVSDLNDEEIIKEYINCDFVTFCSIYEGFGMPIIEANSIGRIVVTSNINPMMEIAHDSAILVDPYNVKSIREGIVELINNDNLRNSIIEKGFLNAKRFKVELLSKEYIKIYRKII